MQSTGFLTGPIPQFNHLHEAFKQSQVCPLDSSISQDQSIRPRPILSQRRLTQQLTMEEWPQYKALRQCSAGTRFEEHCQLHLPQKHKPAVPDSTLRIALNWLEEQADNAQASDLYWKPLSWLGTIRTTSNDAFDPALWSTFVSTSLGLEVPVLCSLPRRNNSPLAKCGCTNTTWTFTTTTSTCTAHSGATKAHDWMVGMLGPLFRTAGHTVRMQHGVTARQANGAATWSSAAMMMMMSKTMRAA